MIKLDQDTLELLSSGSVRQSLNDMRVGIEKESLRVTLDGRLSQEDHPEALGKSLTHKHITTDFSEAQFEFITPAQKDLGEAMEFLKELQVFAAKKLPKGEFMWNASMPPKMECDALIRIAEYGTCNAARIKTLYREGLANRYGKAMQTISGIHYNFSLPESFWAATYEASGSSHSLQKFRSDGYLSLIRNVMRHGWIVLYLFGASPALHKTYVKKSLDGLKELGDDTLFAPYGTSLRMSDLGYTSVVQGKLDIHFNSMTDYLEGLGNALSTSEKLYENIGVFDGVSYKQINTHQLQLENELYGSIRPKRVARNGERPITALCKQGVEYIELRSIDINPFLPNGMDEKEALFLNTLLTHMALAFSPGISTEEQDLLNDQLRLVAWQGRKPGLVLPNYDGQRTLSEIAQELLEDMRDTARVLDSVKGGNAHEAALDAQLAKVHDPEKTPSAKVLERVKAYGSYTKFVQDLTTAQTENLRAVTLDETRDKYQQAMVVQSRGAFEQMEAENADTFDKYLINQQADTDCPPECLQKH